MSLEDIIKKHEKAIYTAAYAAGAAGIPGAFIPTLDITVVGGAWATMTVSIANKSGRKLDKDTAFKLCSTILAGGAAYIGGTKILTYLFHMIPGLGTMGAVGINSLLNFLYTFRMGRFIAMQMEKADFNTEDFASMIPEITAMVFAMPSMAEIRQTWTDYNDHKRY